MSQYLQGGHLFRLEDQSRLRPLKLTIPSLFSNLTFRFSFGDSPFDLLGESPVVTIPDAINVATTGMFPPSGLVWGL
jgi:hypothetical protein